MICQAGTKSHVAHDEIIHELSERVRVLTEAENACKKANESQRKTLVELEAFKKYADMTPRVLAERVLRLEKALTTLSNRYTKMGGKL